MHEGHRERLKERVLKEGLDNFEAHNLLEYLLFYTIPRRDTNEIAHRLINTFGSFSSVLDAPIEELIKIEGLGPNSALFLKMLPQISRRYIEDKYDGDGILNSTEKAGEFILNKFVGRTVEVSYLVVVDSKCKMLGTEIISEGTVNATNVNIRKIIEVCIKYNGTSAILAHNHPNGVAIPSKADAESTLQIYSALKMVNITLLDHIVIADNDYVSMRDSQKFKYIFR